MGTGKKGTGAEPNFQTILQTALPFGRKGKHHEIVQALLEDLEQLDTGRAIRIPLSDLPDTIPNVRSALNRATRKRNLVVATSSDNDFFYVWKPNGRAEAGFHA